MTHQMHIAMLQLFFGYLIIVKYSVRPCSLLYHWFESFCTDNGKNLVHTPTPVTFYTRDILHT